MRVRTGGRVVEIPDERMAKAEGRSVQEQARVPLGTLAAPSPLIFTLQGQIPSGKNAVMITRTGRRYPSKRFKDWRDDAIDQLTNCYTYMMLGDMHLVVDYVPGNKIRRDVPGMLDAICHLLEYTGILQDDAQVKNVEWHQWPLDRKNPKVRVVLSSLNTDT